MRKLSKCDIDNKAERYQDALESYREERWTEVAAMQPEAIAALLVQKLGRQKFFDLIATFLFDPLAEAEFDSLCDPDHYGSDDMERAA